MGRRLHPQYRQAIMTQSLASRPSGQAHSRARQRRARAESERGHLRKLHQAFKDNPDRRLDA